MKILHLCLGCFYIDNSTYQENLLPKYHKKLGYDVEIIASALNQRDGRFFYENDYRQYINEHGIKVTRLKYRGILSVAKKLASYENLSETIAASEPDVIFIHGLQSADAKTVVKYLRKHPDVRVFIDNHNDFNNSAKNFISKEILHKRLWKKSAKLFLPYTKKFYGVLPARVDFLKDVYGLPEEKCELLVMGVDDEILDDAEKENARSRLRKEYAITDNTTLIITGGKINKDRPETLQLMEAVSGLGRDDIHLLVFGNVIDEYKEYFDKLCESPLIHYVGWVNSKQIYEYFQAADLVAFPGLHSVLWEQAVGSGKACIFRKIDGFTHIDIGGNCAFFDSLESDGISKQLAELVDSGRIPEMTKAAQEKGKNYFSYKSIAKRCIE